MITGYIGAIACALFHLAPEICEGTPAAYQRIYPATQAKATGNKGRRQRQSVKVIRFGLWGRRTLTRIITRSHLISLVYASINRSPSSKERNTREYSTKFNLQRSTEVAIHIYPFLTLTDSQLVITRSIISIVASRLEGKDTAARTSTSILRTCSVLGSGSSPFPPRRGL